MTKVNNASSNPWIIVVVEDDEEIRNQIKEYLGDDVFAGRGVSIQLYDDIEKAKSLIKERKADLVILDVYQGDQDPRAEKLGVGVLKEIQNSGFVPVIFYTALPEQVKFYENKFIQIVGKTQGLRKLKQAIEQFFCIKIIPFTRKLYDYVDISLSGYMWEYAQQRWDSIKNIADKPEFMRIILDRLAADIGHPESVHSAEYYILPPISSNLQLGDIRIRPNNGDKEYLITIWPSCDLVVDDTCTPPRKPKTDNVIVVKGTKLEEFTEYKEWKHNQSNTKKGQLEKLLENNRRNINADRFHYLPEAWEIPHLVLDFQLIEYIPLGKLQDLECLATLSSPFAEELANRFVRYIGRLGTPDLEVNTIIDSL